jgi:hypothetical protein
MGIGEVLVGEVTVELRVTDGGVVRVAKLFSSP